MWPKWLRFNKVRETVEAFASKDTPSKDTPSTGQQELKRDHYLLNFRNWSQGGMGEGLFDEATPATRKQETVQIAISPMTVLEELERKPDPFTLQNLDEKLTILRDKATLVRQAYAEREVQGLIERLELRKKYVEFATFFGRFDNTTDEQVTKFCEKHGFVLKSADMFIPAFPDEAVKVMKEYTAQTEKLCGKKPLFFVIATAESFADKTKRYDPILLVQSPFGFYWQILGAWDKEMLIVHEL
jgi:hypothetical protein